MYRARIGRDCLLLGWSCHHCYHRRSTKLAGGLGTVGQMYRTMTFFRAGPLLIV